MEFVAGGVAVEFGQPPGAAIGWGGAVLATAMAMPEAAVHQNRRFVFRQQDVDGDGADRTLCRRRGNEAHSRFG